MQKLRRVISPQEGGLARERPAFPQAAVEEAGRVGLAWRAWLWVALGIGALFRLATLGRQSLWLDESLSFWTAYRPWEELARELMASSVRPLHHILLHLALYLGDSEWMLRLPSAVLGVLSIGLLYAIGRQLFDRRTAALAALLLAFSPLHIWYSQEARMYALVSAMALLAAFFALRALQHNRPEDWILFGFFEGMALWSETGAVWFVLSVNAFAALLVRALYQSGRLLPWLGAQALALILYLPILAHMLEEISSGDTMWIPPATFILLARTVADFAGSFQRTPLESRLAAAALVIGLALGGRRLIQEAFRSPRPPEVPAEERWLAVTHRYLLLGCWLAVPVGLSFLVSQPYVRLPLVSLVFRPGQSIFLARNLITALFPLCLLLARSLSLARPSARAIFTVLFLAFNFAAYLGNTIPERKDDYRSAARLVARQARPGDRILFAPPYLEAPFAYYYDDREQAFGISEQAVEDGVIASERWTSYANPAQALPESGRVWLITTTNVHQTDSLGTTAEIAARSEPAGRWKVAGVIIRLFDVQRGSP